jgi:phosphatidylserine decarboxylase
VYIFNPFGSFGSILISFETFKVGSFRPLISYDDLSQSRRKEYFKDTRLQVSIFMSPFNMHSNRYPVSGRIKYVGYHPGHYFVAWHPKSSELSERSSVVIETNNGAEILIRQIAGAVARRIVTYAKENEEVRQGDELGL